MESESKAHMNFQMGIAMLANFLDKKFKAKENYSSPILPSSKENGLPIRWKAWPPSIIHLEIFIMDLMKILKRKVLAIIILQMGQSTLVSFKMGLFAVLDNFIMEMKSA